MEMDTDEYEFFYIPRLLKTESVFVLIPFFLGELWKILMKC